VVFGDVDAGRAGGGGCETMVVSVEKAARVTGEVSRAETDLNVVGGELWTMISN